MAGEVIAVGEDVKDKWKVGDKVCANFCTEHLFGDPTPESAASSLGGQSPGVLTQFRAFPAYSLVKFPEHLSYVQASTLPFVLLCLTVKSSGANLVFSCAALTAYHALYGPNPLKAGDFVLVLGTGGVST